MSFVSFWLPGGLYLSTLLINQRRHWLWFVLAAFIANISFDVYNGQKLQISLLFCCANSIEALVGASILKHKFPQKFPIFTLKGLVSFIGVSAVLSTPIGAILGSAVITFSLGVNSPYLQTFMLWWSSDFLGILLFVPLFFSLLDMNYQKLATLKSPRIFEFIILGFSLCIAAMYVFQENIYGPDSLGYVMFVFVVWAALRFGVWCVAVCNILIAMILVRLYVVFANTAPLIKNIHEVSYIQLFITFMIFMDLFLAVSFFERNKAEKKIIELAKFCDENPNPVLSLNRSGELINKNKSVDAILKNNDFTEKDILKILPGDIMGTVLEVINEGKIIEGVEVSVDGKVYSYTISPGSDDQYVNLYSADITERKKLEKVKDSLVRDISHSLKTPIAMTEMAVNIGANAVERKDFDAIKEAQSIAGKNIERVRKDVAKILEAFSLDVSMLDNKQQHQQQSSIKTVVKNSIEINNALIKSKAIEVKQQILSQADIVAVEERYLVSVIGNIIDNAVKFTDDNGNIKITSTIKDEWIQIEVKDSGCGLSDVEKEQVFDKFYKSNETMEGTGLGLWICKEIVRLYKGEIEFLSQGEGKGSAVIVKFPITLKKERLS